MDGKILVIDPSHVERQKIRHLLALLGSFDVCEAANPDEYQMLAEQITHPLLVIMDIALPAETDGFRVLESIRTHLPKDTSVIVATRSSGLEHQEAALKFGVNDFIVKPYSIDRLKKSIQSMLPKEPKFEYSTKGISHITLTFDDFMARELKYAQRTGIPVSLVLLARSTPSEGKEADESQAAAGIRLFLSALIPEIRKILRATDTVVGNTNGDVIILLPDTTLSQVQAVQSKIISCGTRVSSEHNQVFDQAYVSISVSFPEEGDSFQSLMKAAFHKLENREMLDKTGSIPAKTRQFARKRYNQFNRWF